MFSFAASKVEMAGCFVLGILPWMLFLASLVIVTIRSVFLQFSNIILLFPQPGGPTTAWAYFIILRQNATSILKSILLIISLQLDPIDALHKVISTTSDKLSYVSTYP